MTTKHTPATLLPWRVGDAGLTVFGPPNGKPAPRTVVGGGSRADTAYIAHAANAYPQLVAALRDAQTALDAGLNSGDAVSAAQEMDDAALMLRDLMRSLGEAK